MEKNDGVWEKAITNAGAKRTHQRQGVPVACSFLVVFDLVGQRRAVLNYLMEQDFFNN